MQNKISSSSSFHVMLSPGILKLSLISMIAVILSCVYLSDDVQEIECKDWWCSYTAANMSSSENVYRQQHVMQVSVIAVVQL